MAVQANTLGRAKSMGVGAVTNSQGLAIMNSILSSSNLLVGAVPVRWGKYLKSAYPQVPNFLKDFEAEAKKEAAEARAARGEASGGGSLSALAGLSPEERLEAVRASLRDLAREVIDSADLEADHALMDSGMDSLSGVEFRNRLQTEFDGVNLPNSMVFDYPTVTELAGYINSQLGDLPAEASSASTAPVAAAPAAETYVESLNAHCVTKGVESPESRPIFLVPGAGMQAGSFRSLAQRLALPSYGLSWPRGLPRSQWPSSLKDLSEHFFKEIQKIQPQGPYLFAGHSFGANVCLEMANVVRAAGQQVSMVILLDPRSLLPLDVNVEKAFEDSGLTESLALLCQTLPGNEAQKYQELLSSLQKVEVQDRDEAIKKALNPSALASLEHLHETTQWYSSLLQNGAVPESNDVQCVRLQAPMAWKTEAAEENMGEKIVREFQAKNFQEDELVTKKLKGGVTMKVPGTHFSMMHEDRAAQPGGAELKVSGQGCVLRAERCRQGEGCRQGGRGGSRHRSRVWGRQRAHSGRDPGIVLPPGEGHRRRQQLPHPQQPLGRAVTEGGHLHPPELLRGAHEDSGQGGVAVQGG